MKKLAVCWSQFSRKASDWVRISANLLNLHWKPTVSQVARAWYWGKKWQPSKHALNGNILLAFVTLCFTQKYPDLEGMTCPILYTVNLSPLPPQSLVPVTDFVKGIFLLVGLLAWFFLWYCCLLLLIAEEVENWKDWSLRLGSFLKKDLPSGFNMQVEDIGGGMWPCTFGSFLQKGAEGGL